MPKLSAQAKEQRRRTLLDAAWRCVAKSGYRNLSVDAVCAEAGLSKGAFYTYFAQKQDLLLALMDDDAAGLNDVLADAAGQSNGVDRIRHFAAALLDRASEPATVQLRADLWAEIAANDGLRDRFLSATKARRARLKALIEEALAVGDIVDVPSNALASVLLALGDGLMLHRVLDPSGFRWTNVRRALNVLLEGLEVPERR